MKEVTELMLTILDGAGFDVMWSLEREETEGPGQIPRVRTGDHHTLSHTTPRDFERGLQR